MRESLKHLNKSLEAKGISLTKLIDKHIEEVNRSVNKDDVTEI